MAIAAITSTPRFVVMWVMGMTTFRAFFPADAFSPPFSTSHRIPKKLVARHHMIDTAMLPIDLPMTLDLHLASPLMHGGTLPQSPSSIVDVGMSLAMTTIPLTVHRATPTIGTLIGSNFVDPVVEAEIFNDLAHVALDFTTLLGYGTARSVTIQAAAVAGRVFAIASDYLPDHAMLPEEFVFQACMLTMAVAGLMESLHSVLRANAGTKGATIRDKKCFSLFFRETGMTWTEYKVLAAAAFEWMDVVPNAELSVLPSSLVWPYRGNMRLREGQGPEETVAGCNSKHLFGDMDLCFVDSSDDIRGPVHSMTTNSNNNNNKMIPDDDDNDVQDGTVRLSVGKDGATVLLIDTEALQAVMARDKQIENAVRSLSMRQMKKRIAHLLSNQH